MAPGALGLSIHALSKPTNVSMQRSCWIGQLPVEDIRLPDSSGFWRRPRTFRNGRYPTDTSVNRPVRFQPTPVPRWFRARLRLCGCPGRRPLRCRRRPGSARGTARHRQGTSCRRWRRRAPAVPRCGRAAGRPGRCWSPDGRTVPPPAASTHMMRVRAAASCWSGSRTYRRRSAVLVLTLLQGTPFSTGDRDVFTSLLGSASRFSRAPGRAAIISEVASTSTAPPMTDTPKPNLSTSKKRPLPSMVCRERSRLPDQSHAPDRQPVREEANLARQAGPACRVPSPPAERQTGGAEHPGRRRSEGADNGLPVLFRRNVCHEAQTAGKDKRSGKTGQ